MSDKATEYLLKDGYVLICFENRLRCCQIVDSFGLLVMYINISQMSDSIPDIECAKTKLFELQLLIPENAHYYKFCLSLFEDL